MKGKFVNFLVLFALMFTALAVPTGTVAAAGIGEEGKPPQTPRGVPFVEKAFQAQLKALETQATNLERADQFSDRVEQIIARLQENGLNTTPLEEALNIYKEKMALAHQSHDQAAEILGNHDGFDEDGKVTDIQAARETVKQAGQSLRESRQTMRQAFVDLRQAIREFREANQPDKNS